MHIQYIPIHFLCRWLLELEIKFILIMMYNMYWYLQLKESWCWVLLGITPNMSKDRLIWWRVLWGQQKNSAVLDCISVILGNLFKDRWRWLEKLDFRRRRGGFQPLFVFLLFEMGISLINSVTELHILPYPWGHIFGFGIDHNDLLKCNSHS